MTMVNGISYVEVTVPMSSRKPDVQGVPYCDERTSSGIFGDNTGRIRLFTLLSLFPTDHAVFYLFIDGAPSLDRVKRFVAENAEQWGYRLVVVEMGEAFTTVEAAAEKAAGLRSAFANANVVFPPLQLAEPATA